VLSPSWGCAGFEDERHVAPIFSELSLAGGEREIEALGGAVLLRRDPTTLEVRYWALRPLISDERRSDTERFGWFLPPLGSYRRTTDESVLQLLPLFRYAERHPPAEPVTWSFLALPGIFWAKTDDGRVVRAWFPFGGIVEGFLSFDRAWFVLFPLFTRIHRHGRTTTHVLWPVFSVSTGEGGPAWRVWPLVGRNRWEGRYDRWFFLWPVFHWQRNDLGHSVPERSWMVWPLFGRRRQGPSHSWTALWPFFGYTANAEKGFWAWDGPWPLVMLQEPGTSGQASRVRFWPLYSRYEGDGLVSRHYLWPFFNRRDEEYPTATKQTVNLLPVWHAWDRYDEEEGHSRWRKLFPLFRSYRADLNGEDFYAFPTLNPLWRLRFIDEHYAWMWELYAERRLDDRLSARSWLGLWRREKDRDEDRRSLAGLWARRNYSSAGRAVQETSLLFGLLRWRETERGMSLMRPAFPGPGWPLARVPNTLPLEGEP